MIKTFEDKYKPLTFKELAFENAGDRRKLLEYATGQRNGHLLLVGDYGCGKSVAARMIAQERGKAGVYGGRYEFLSATVAAEDLRAALDQLERTWALEAFGTHRALPAAVFDELHILQPMSNQYKLRAFMDRVKTGIFVFTANRLNSIDGSVLSRCDVVELTRLSPANLFPRCKEILAAESVHIDDDLLIDLLGTTDGSWPSAMRALEDAVVMLKSGFSSRSISA